MCDYDKNYLNRPGELRAQTARGLGADSAKEYRVSETYAGTPTPAAPLGLRLEHRLHDITGTADGIMRARQILSEHPEFEQFIELQSLINRHGL